jgi:hypothetical protein
MAGLGIGGWTSSAEATKTPPPPPPCGTIIMAGNPSLTGPDANGNLTLTVVQDLGAYVNGQLVPEAPCGGDTYALDWQQYSSNNPSAWVQNTQATPDPTTTNQQTFSIAIPASQLHSVSVGPVVYQGQPCSGTYYETQIHGFIYNPTGPNGSTAPDILDWAPAGYGYLGNTLSPTGQPGADATVSTQACGQGGSGGSVGW